MYSTYQQYNQRGGKLQEEEYNIMAQRAGELIDYYTMGRAASSEKMEPSLCACECDVIDLLAELSVSDTVKSINNDGYSVTYLEGAEQQSKIMEKMKIHLSFPENLLSYSGYAFV